jgi:hypothetical protein
MAIAVSVTNGGVNAIVGSAISAALLAPIVNAGICFSFAFKYHAINNAVDDANFYAQIGGVSLCLLRLFSVIIVSFSLVCLLLCFLTHLS